ncbi:MAG: hypothetical protein EOO13_11685 [Chitinophagaceae bacterium]|nr:MAG: hypothetical protein EOO13_11685 [Chitinophagaceae bacterium]
MALEEFERDEQAERNKGYARMKSIMDYGMGVLWAAMGVFIAFIEKFNTGLESRFGDTGMKLFGGVCIVYGLFRIYRGYKKNYFRER